MGYCLPLLWQRQGLWPGHWTEQSPFQHLGLRIEASYLTYPFGIRLIGLFGNKADEFCVFHQHTVALGQMLDGGVDLAHGSDAEVGDVHADLGAAVGEHANGFDAVEASVGGADVSGDGAGGGDVRLVEVDVVGDEEAAGADDAGSCGRVEFGAAYVGAAGGITEDGVAEAFELRAAAAP